MEKMTDEKCACASPGDVSALVLSGGGALGAYEAGVLSYVLDAFEKETGVEPQLSLFTGTSIGALNASFIAATAENFKSAARQLVEFWSSIAFKEILRYRTRELISLLRLNAGQVKKPPFAKSKQDRLPSAPHQPVPGVFDTTPLIEKVKERIPWSKLQENLASGQVRAIALCATEVCAGVSTVFYQTSAGVEYRSSHDPLRQSKRVRIGVDHAMASAAMPLFFPSVQIDGVCYTDGGLRQNTPLNPALRLGADRVLVVSLSQDPLVAASQARIECRRNPEPGPVFLLGRMINILVSQSLDYELSQIEMYNKIIANGCAVYGAEFTDEFNRLIGGHRNATFRPIKSCHIRPSSNPFKLALKALDEASGEVELPGLTGKAVGKLLDVAAHAESELLCFLMFTPSYIQTLLALGYEDARRHKDDLVELFSP